MKKIKHPVRTTLLTTLVAAISVFGGCVGCKALKKTPPTPEEQWAKDREIREKLIEEVIYEKKAPTR